jgi:hypothetical protein
LDEIGDLAFHQADLEPLSCQGTGILGGRYYKWPLKISYYLLNVKLKILFGFINIFVNV